MDALANESVDLIVAIGRDVDPARFGSLPDNVRVTEYVDQPLLLERCDVFVTHGGFNSVKEAAILGLPMVVVPISADQPYSAQRCAALGIGRTITPDNRSAGAIQDAVNAVLGDPEYRDKCQALPGRDEGACRPRELGGGARSGCAQERGSLLNGRGRST